MYVYNNELIIECTYVKYITIIHFFLDEIVTIYCENNLCITPDKKVASMSHELTQRGGRLVRRKRED